MTSNRYLIYKLLGRRVKCDAKGHGKKVKSLNGIVDKVTRDIFENCVVLTVSGKSHKFDEPAAILEDGDNIVFVYGDLDEFDDSDDAFFKDVRDSAYGGSILDVLRRAPTGTKTLSFQVGPKIQEKRRQWNRRTHSS